MSDDKTKQQPETEDGKESVFKFSIRAKLVCAFGIILAATIVVGWRGVAGMRYINESLNAINTNQFVPLRTIANANIALIAWNRATLNHVLAESHEKMDGYEQIMAEQKLNVLQRLEALSGSNYLSNRGKELLEELQRNFGEADPVRDRVVKLSKAGSQDEAREVIRTQLRANIDEIDSHMTEFIRLQEKQMEAVMTETNGRLRQAMIRILTIMGAAILFSLIIAFMVSKRIAGGIGQAVQIANAVTEDIFEREGISTAPSADEIEYLGIVINHMRSIIEWSIDERNRGEEELLKHREHLEELVVDRTSKLVQANRITQAINEVFQNALTCETEEQFGKACLAVTERLTDSKFGIFLELNANGLLDTIAISNPGWAACDMTVADATQHIKNMEIRGIDRSTVREGKSRIVNGDELKTHPDRIGTPEGHPEITAFLGVPLMREGKAVGMVGLGNKEGGYELADQKAVEAICVAIVEALRYKRMHLALIEIQKKLARKERLAMLGQFAGVMGHEIRNPLGVISNSIYFLDMKIEDGVDEKIDKHLKILQTEVGNCDKIVSDILGFARMKAPTLAEHDINCLAKKTILKAAIPKSVKVQTDLGENLPKVMVDISQMEQVFSNMISNAVQAMPEGGELKIATNQVDSSIAVAFGDTGCGILEENLDKVFDPLFSTKAKGIGFGLTVCQTIIEGHRGKIEVQSETNKGTTFTAIIPLTQEM